MQQAFALKVDPDAPTKDDQFRQDLNVRLECPDCRDQGNIQEEFSSGDLVCGNCGPSLSPLLLLLLLLTFALAD